MSKGKPGGNGQDFEMALEANLMNIFREILNTPSYWRKMRSEIFARMEQLGPFHFFFTLSCAENRWQEVKASLLKLKGFNVSFVFNDGSEEPQILVEGLPLEVFTEQNQKVIKDLYKDKFIEVTRLFDDRLKAFKKIYLESGDIAHYCYRIEFQARGKLNFVFFGIYRVSC